MAMSSDAFRGQRGRDGRIDRCPQTNRERLGTGHFIARLAGMVSCTWQTLVFDLCCLGAYDIVPVGVIIVQKLALRGEHWRFGFAQNLGKFMAGSVTKRCR
jgi:hypothetical protein